MALIVVNPSPPVRVEQDQQGGGLALLFDLLLILRVLASVAVVILDSVQSMQHFDTLFRSQAPATRRQSSMKP